MKVWKRIPWRLFALKADPTLPEERQWKWDQTKTPQRLTTPLGVTYEFRLGHGAYVRTLIEKEKLP